MAKTKPHNSTKLMTILTIAAILVIGAGTFVLIGGNQSAQNGPSVSGSQSSTQGHVTANVVAGSSTSTGTVYVNVR